MEHVSQAELNTIGAAVIPEQLDEVTTWMYIRCRLMAAKGLLEFKGMSYAHGKPDYFVYHDPETNDILAIQRPFIGREAERLLMDRMVTLARGLPN
ncbi:MAG TPA: hypothetical protein VGM37_05020 [Armatimonadota bacterium]|jgi:hypothetical protein